MNRRRPAAARVLLAAFGLIALLSGLEPFALLALILLVAACMPVISRAQQVACALLVLFGANALVLTLLAVLDVSWHAHLIVAAYLVVSGFAPERARGQSTRPKPWVGADLWAVLAAIASFAVFYRPFVGVSLGRKLALLSFSTDGGNHLSYVRTDLLLASYDHASQYPQAWAGNVGITVDLLVGQRSSASTFISVAVPLILGFYALLVFFAVSLISSVLDGATTLTSRLGAGVAAVCFCLSAIVGACNLLLESASYTQILALTVLLAVGLLLSSPELTDSWWSLAVLGFLGLGLMQTWYLLAPVLAVLLFMYLRSRRPSFGRSLLMATPFGIAALYPIAQGPPAVAQINAPGGTPFPGPVTVVTLLLLLLLGLVMTLTRRALRRQFRVLTALVLGSLVLTTLIVLLQDVTGSGPNYYADKVLFAALLFASVLGAALAGTYVQLLVRRQGQTQGKRWVTGASALVLLGGYAFAAFDSRELRGAYAAGRPPNFLDGRVLDAIFVAHPRGLPRGTEVWIADGCLRGQDRLANKWTHDLYPEADIDPDWPVTNIDYVLAKSGDVQMLLQRAAKPEVKVFEIYVHHECDPQAVGALLVAPKVRVVQVP